MNESNVLTGSDTSYLYRYPSDKANGEQDSRTSHLNERRHVCFGCCLDEKTTGSIEVYMSERNGTTNRFIPPKREGDGTILPLPTKLSPHKRNVNINADADNAVYQICTATHGLPLCFFPPFFLANNLPHALTCLEVASCLVPMHHRQRFLRLPWLVRENSPFWRCRGQGRNRVFR